MSHIQPGTHESKGHLYYYPESDRYDGLDPYWLLGDLLINEFDGYQEIEHTIGQETVRIELAYSMSGFAPRPEDDVQNRLYEFELHLSARGQRKCHFNLSPRFPVMQHYETGEEISVPFDHLDADEGLSVQFQASNYDIEEIPDLLSEALDALADAADVSLHETYFDTPQSGRIEEIERYVRLTRNWNRKLIQKGGLMDQLAMLLSTEKGTVGEHKWDNSEAVGYIHQLRLCPNSAQELIPHHHRGRQIKSYLPEEPDNFDEDDPLYHPKLGVLFRKSLNNSNSVRWKDRQELVNRLDETIINLLRWADIPACVEDDDRDDQERDGGGSNTVFVADDHFHVVPGDETAIFDDPTPRLEAKQDHLLLTILQDMTDSDSDIVESIATDGGQDVNRLSEESGYSLSTIYRALKRLDGLLETDDGHVRFVSAKIAEEIRGIVQSTEHAIENAADRAAELFDIEVNNSSNSAVSRWLAKYGAEFVPEAKNGRGKIRIDTIMACIESAPTPYLPDALDELVQAWLKDGRGKVNIEDIFVDVDLYNGDHYLTPVRTLR